MNRHSSPAAGLRSGKGQRKGAARAAHGEAEADRRPQAAVGRRNSDAVDQPNERERSAERLAARRAEAAERGGLAGSRQAVIADQAPETVQSNLDAARERIGSLARENARLRAQMQRLERVAGRMRQMALHDHLTGLPNRGLLLDRLRQAIAQAQRDDSHVAVLMLDLDRFKAVNDHYGHAVGDWLLQQVASRLDAAVRASDTASRLGGDEFVVMLPRIVDPRVVLTVAAKLRATLDRPHAMGQELLEARPSIGAAIYPMDGRTPAELLEHADAAMYRDKARRALPADWPGGGQARGAALNLPALPSADATDGPPRSGD